MPIFIANIIGIILIVIAIALLLVGFVYSFLRYNVIKIIKLFARLRA